jgi:hypothetical protein
VEGVPDIVEIRDLVGGELDQEKDPGDDEDIGPLQDKGDINPPHSTGQAQEHSDQVEVETRGPTGAG